MGIHTFAVGQLAVYVTWDPGEVAIGSFVAATVDVPGAALGDFTLASFSLDLSNLTLSSYVSSANTVTVILSNPSGSAKNLASGTLSVLVFKARAMEEGSTGPS